MVSSWNIPFSSVGFFNKKLKLSIIRKNDLGLLLYKSVSEGINSFLIKILPLSELNIYWY